MFIWPFTKLYTLSYKDSIIVYHEFISIFFKSIGNTCKAIITNTEIIKYNVILVTERSKLANNGSISIITSLMMNWSSGLLISLSKATSFIILLFWHVLSALLDLVSLLLLLLLLEGYSPETVLFKSIRRFSA